ncbi:DUF2087 domain-containing protein [uncultured Leifsonia sp.]|uniref:DUF2087 domain-containing protein n=1 Tax=Leifsonia sp. TaxID=1870902 RepID=UPI0028D57A76|nr:DUF2087 domain-containing protein [uncultured Leifsonia sp.]
MADNDWRRMLAALANQEARTAFARVTLGLPLGETTRERRALDTLVAAGLVSDGAVSEAGIRAALAGGHSRPTGVERFLDADGRIDRYPSGAADREALLRWVAERALRPGEVLAERDLTDRLARFTGDPVALRRYLVDAGLVARTPSGSEYALP